MRLSAPPAVSDFVTDFVTRFFCRPGPAPGGYGVTAPGQSHRQAVQQRGRRSAGHSVGPWFDPVAMTRAKYPEEAFRGAQNT
jgi:hypothetical protein